MRALAEKIIEAFAKKEPAEAQIEHPNFWMYQ